MIKENNSRSLSFYCQADFTSTIHYQALWLEISFANPRVSLFMNNFVALLSALNVSQAGRS